MVEWCLHESAQAVDPVLWSFVDQLRGKWVKQNCVDARCSSFVLTLASSGVWSLVLSRRARGEGYRFHLGVPHPLLVPGLRIVCVCISDR